MQATHNYDHLPACSVKVFLIYLPQEAVEDCKTIVSRLSKLKNEMQTDKPVVALTDTERDDLAIWNKYLEEETFKNRGESPSWFQSAWLYVECYMYRRIMEAIHLRYALIHLCCDLAGSVRSRQH